jgi:hypothetical protein
MHVLVEIAALLFPVFTSYAWRIWGVNSRLSEVLAEEIPGLSPTQMHRILAPRGQWISLALAVLFGAILLGIGHWVFPWYWALAIFAGSLGLLLLTNYLIPSDKTPHYLKVILRNLKRKSKQELERGDEEQAKAMEDLAQKLEVLAAERKLFEEKAPIY